MLIVDDLRVNAESINMNKWVNYQ